MNVRVHDVIKNISTERIQVKIKVIKHSTNIWISFISSFERRKNVVVRVSDISMRKMGDKEIILNPRLFSFFLSFFLSFKFLGYDCGTKYNCEKVGLSINLKKSKVSCFYFFKLVLGNVWTYLFTIIVIFFCQLFTGTWISLLK